MQFHVYRISGGRLVVDLQSDVPALPTRVIAPLIPLETGPKPLTILEPVFELEGRPHALHTAELVAAPAALLRGTPVADLTAHDYEIRRALDMLFSGFRADRPGSLSGGREGSSRPGSGSTRPGS